MSVYFSCLLSLTVREPEGGLKLYSKGADLVILERLQKDDTNQERIEAALEVSGQIFFFSAPLMSPCKVTEFYTFLSVVI